MAYKISDACVNCGACEGECPVGAISEADGKRVIDASVCAGCGACAAIADAVFAMGDDGLAENVLGGEVPSDLVDMAQEACDSCPVQAIEAE